MKLFDMKKLATLTLALFVVAGAAYGQDRTASDQTTATLEVLAGLGLSVPSGSTLDLGAVLPGATASVEAESSGAVQFNATGEEEEDITVTYSNTTLTGPGAALTFVPSVISGESTDQATASEASSGTSNLTLTSGTHYFWVGGSVNVPSGQTQGNYSGTFTLNIEYTNL